MTRTQQNNAQEWMERIEDAHGLSGVQSICLFNRLPIEWQQLVIRRPWYRPADGKPIRRPLLPPGFDEVTQ